MSIMQLCALIFSVVVFCYSCSSREAVEVDIGYLLDPGQGEEITTESGVDPYEWIRPYLGKKIKTEGYLYIIDNDIRVFENSNPNEFDRSMLFVDGITNSVAGSIIQNGCIGERVTIIAGFFPGYIDFVEFRDYEEVNISSTGLSCM